jgi:hypothetical protein
LLITVERGVIAAGHGSGMDRRDVQLLDTLLDMAGHTIRAIVGSRHGDRDELDESSV